MIKKLLSKIKDKLTFEFSKSYRPVMKGGYRRYDGVFLKQTRVSNTTFIDHKDKLFIEDNVFIGHFNYLEASNGLSIGEGCQITNFVGITTHSSHDSIRLYGSHFQDYTDLLGYLKGPVTIGKYTFVGPHSLIMPGTKIGKGCLIAAYSLVHGEFPDFSVISGNPAKITGDTRDRDRKLLVKYPELKEFYKEWSDESLKI